MNRSTLTLTLCSALALVMACQSEPTPETLQEHTTEEAEAVSPTPEAPDVQAIAQEGIASDSPSPTDVPVSESVPVPAEPPPVRVNRLAKAEEGVTSTSEHLAPVIQLLGSKGTGLGGGGTAEGLGGLGTRGVGSGATGYGIGGGSFGGKASSPRGRAPRDTESYRDYGVNDTTLVTDDPLSTFSIDVDTASYTVARRKLLEGRLPPRAAVRVEEFVNYFPYDYEEPKRGVPFAVDLEATPHPWIGSHHIVRVGLQGKSYRPEEREPVHLTFLVDVSGSMSRPDKIGYAQRSLRYLVESLDPSDTVALATYAGRVAEILPPTSARDRATIFSAIEGLRAGGSTAMSSGIDLAYQMADRSFVAGHENRVIVLSDGDANVGKTSHEQILKQIRRYADKGITLSTIGLGMGNYKDTMMEQLANKGDGNHYYIDSLNEAKRVFAQDLAGTVRTIAKDVKIQVAFDPESVISYRLIGYENRDIADRDFRNDAVDAGEVGSGHRVTALYDVVLRDKPRRSLATVRVRNKQPGPDGPAAEHAFTIRASDVGKRFASASSDLRVAFAASQFAEVLRGSRHAEEVRLGDVADLARAAARPGVQEDAELVRLIEAAERLSADTTVARTLE